MTKFRYIFYQYQLNFLHESIKLRGDRLFNSHNNKYIANSCQYQATLFMDNINNSSATHIQTFNKKNIHLDYI